MSCTRKPSAQTRPGTDLAQTWQKLCGAFLKLNGCWDGQGFSILCVVTSALGCSIGVSLSLSPLGDAQACMCLPTGTEGAPAAPSPFPPGGALWKQPGRDLGVRWSLLSPG